jgi:adenylate cyclase
MMQRLRLMSGLILFVYVTTHLLNHALGMVSVEAAEAGAVWFVAFWRHPIGTVLLYSSLTCHLGLALYAVYARWHARLPRWELVRLGLGLLIPLQLLQHIVGTRVQHEAFVVQDGYTRQVLTYWVLNPLSGLQQVLLLIVAWAHGCMGLYYWLRVTPTRRWTVPALLILAVVVPVCAVGGFIGMGHEVSVRAEDPGWLQRAAGSLAPPDAARANLWRDSAVLAYVSLLGCILAGNRLRTVWHRRRRGTIRLTYPSGRQVTVTRGMTVLDASRQAGIPHVSMCGGRGRCSTCRIRIGSGAALVPKPSAAERRVLQRVGASQDIRLACQLQPSADLDVFPLLVPAPRAAHGRAGAGGASGREQEVAVLFADLRAYTRFAERRLPFDVVFVLNQYFAAMGQAVEQSGGYLDKFIGDGVMAIFGLEGQTDAGCRQALVAALKMGRAMDDLNRQLTSTLREPLQIGVAIHVGPAIIGEMGYGRAHTLTAIGDTVNTASRFETLNKQYGSQLIISEDVAARAGLDLAAVPRYQVEVVGRTAPVTIRAIPSLGDLEPALLARDRSPG